LEIKEKIIWIYYHLF